MSEEHLSTIIVLVVVYNKEDELLMVQEAKKECKGKWYLPGKFLFYFLKKKLAGRVKQGEHLIDAAIRETKEESGLIIKPEGIFSVEYERFYFFYNLIQ